ncbi:MAG: Rrf2 family transcriptional regulator [Acetobacteraceae bacterium]|nr:Rrf2 family transcriptional regulator [Acetobacteraceae bacterium]
MRLTAFTDYTLRTLIYLGLRPQKLVTIADIAGAYDISANHLMKVVHQLAQSGDIVTLRGQHGGLRLARPADQINLGAVVRRTEPDMEIATCFGSDPGCRIRTVCVFSNILGEALQGFLAVLDRYTLADLIAGHRDSLVSLLGIPDETYPAAVALPNATEIAWESVVPSGSSLEP